MNRAVLTWVPGLVLVLCVSAAWAQDAAETPRSGERVTLAEVTGDVEVRSGGAAGIWDPATAGQVLSVEDEICTGVKSTARLRFADHSEVIIEQLTEVGIAAFQITPEVAKTDLDLKYGSLDIKVKKGTQANDFKVRTPVYTTGVTGSEEQVSYYPGYGGKASMREGSALVSVNPTRRIVAGETTDNRLTSPIVFSKLGNWTPLNFQGWTPEEFASTFWWGTHGPGSWDNLRNNNPANSNIWGQIRGGNTEPPPHDHSECCEE